MKTTIVLQLITVVGSDYNIPFLITVLDDNDVQIYETVVERLTPINNVQLNQIKVDVVAEFTSRWEQYLSQNATNVTNAITQKLDQLKDALDKVVE